MAGPQTFQAPGTMNLETHVENIIRRTSDVKSFRFEKPSGFEFKAGQWMYVNIMVEGTNKLHHFTISASPTEN
jgi:ferredoxin-NADP reductase